MLHTLKNPDSKFNLLHLDYNEILLQSTKCYFFNLNNSETTPLIKFTNKHNFNKSNLKEFFNDDYNNKLKKSIIKGNLHFTNVSVIFQPDNIILPIFKLKYFDSKSLRIINILDIADLDSTTKNINFKSIN